ncbi:LPD7 domain-containing protein [Phenylobacterium deserti]|uniref:Large polyvalent protein-associated domain-containing protein n=1 Tax=Phenylobacterium deserti TaxID=1914756 RepID=A0A328AE55_9CAUL|nr:LPD7 domain-containing protein [Phenylobacterium deserti]RAK52767.1 hypothetical protein DJ018_11300 [Phenylobacterium deserti]
MADRRNRLSADADAPTDVAGDLPEPLNGRYFREPAPRGRVRLFRDATGRAPVLEDAGRRLTALRNDPQLVRDLVAIAAHRGWTRLRVEGAPEFRRAVWLEARLAGLEVQGHRPSERDRQYLARRTERAARRTQGRPGPRDRPADADRRLEIIRRVLQARVADPELRARVLAYAQRRLGRRPERQRDGPERSL